MQSKALRAISALVLLLGGMVALLAWLGRTPKSARVRSSESPQSEESTAQIPAAAQRSADVATRAKLPGEQASSGALFAHFGWGSGQSGLARDRPEEANPEAPMSLLATEDGAIILDQLNGRVVHVDKKGKFVREDRLHVQAAQEMARGPNGELAVMDRLVSKEVEIFDKTGRSIGTLPLEGKGIDNGGATSGLFVSGGKVYAEREHSVVIELGSLSGQVSTERTVLSGRPTRDGTALLSAGRGDADHSHIWVNSFDIARKTMRWARDVGLGISVRQILFLETDAKGTVYLATELARSDEDVSTLLLCMSGADGHVLGQVSVPTNTMPEETFRDFSVRDDGTVLYVHRTEQGSNYLEFHCPP